MPTDCHLDGEFWIKRDNFDRLSGLCRSFQQSQAATQVKFVCFDSVDNQAMFEERYGDLKGLLGQPKSVDEIIADEVSERMMETISLS